MVNQREHFFISWRELRKYTEAGKEELAFKLKEERFYCLKDSNRFFKKHLGFTYHFDKNIKDIVHPAYKYEIKMYKIEIYNKSKFLCFKLKYDL